MTNRGAETAIGSRYGAVENVRSVARMPEAYPPHHAAAMMAMKYPKPMTGC